MANDMDGAESLQHNLSVKKLCIDRCAKAAHVDVAEMPTPSFSERVRDVTGQLGDYLLGTNLSFDGADFLRRCAGHCEGAKLAHRRHKLELWLRVLLVFARRLLRAKDDGDREVVGRFAQINASGRVGRVTRHHPDDDGLTYKLEFEDNLGAKADWYSARDIDLLPAGWRTWMADIPCFLGKGRTVARRAPLHERGDDQEQLSLVLVRIPFDIGAGQELGVLLPDGAEIPIVVPCGIAPVTLLRLWYDKRAGVLGMA